MLKKKKAETQPHDFLLHLKTNKTPQQLPSPTLLMDFYLCGFSFNIYFLCHTTGQSLHVSESFKGSRENRYGQVSANAALPAVYQFLKQVL